MKSRNTLTRSASRILLAMGLLATLAHGMKSPCSESQYDMVTLEDAATIMSKFMKSKQGQDFKDLGALLKEIMALKTEAETHDLEGSEPTPPTPEEEESEQYETIPVHAGDRVESYYFYYGEGGYDYESQHRPTAEKLVLGNRYISETREGTVTAIYENGYVDITFDDEVRYYDETIENIEACQLIEGLWITKILQTSPVPQGAKGARILATTLEELKEDDSEDNRYVVSYYKIQTDDGTGKSEKPADGAVIAVFANGDVNIRFDTADDSTLIQRINKDWVVSAIPDLYTVFIDYES